MPITPVDEFIPPEGLPALRETSLGRPEMGCSGTKTSMSGGWTRDDALTALS